MGAREIPQKGKRPAFERRERREREFVRLCKWAEVIDYIVTIYIASFV